MCDSLHNLLTEQAKMKGQGKKCPDGEMNATPKIPKIYLAVKININNDENKLSSAENLKYSVTYSKHLLSMKELIYTTNYQFPFLFWSMNLLH